MHMTNPSYLDIAPDVQHALSTGRAVVALESTIISHGMPYPQNVATALQMISWGLEVNDYGNAQLDASGNFIKARGEGMTEELWTEMVAHADSKGWKKGDYKSLNLPFENDINRSDLFR